MKYAKYESVFPQRTQPETVCERKLDSPAYRVRMQPNKQAFATSQHNDKHDSLQPTDSISNYSFDNGRMKICVKWLIKREGPKT